jgi:hypothetical protein
MFEIGEQIPPVLDAAGDAYKTLADSGFIEITRATAGVSRTAWMTRKRLHSAERNRIPGKLQMTEKLESRSFPAMQVDRKEAAWVIALLLRNADLLRIIE